MKNLERVWALILEHTGLLASVLILVFIGGALIQSASRPFWNDEYFTAVVAEQGSVAKMFKALDAGVDPGPPLFHFVTLLTTRAAGLTRTGLRLPAVIGFATMMLGLYLFVSRALPGAAGRVSALIAMMLPMITGLAYYASEGRAYGLMLGFFTLSLLCWQASRNSWFWSLMCGLLLACAVLTHSYAIFLLGPLILAEGVWSYVQRRANPGFVLAPVMAIAAVLPTLMQRQKFATFSAAVTRPSLSDLSLFYSVLLDPMATELALLIVLIAALWALEKPTPPSSFTMTPECAALVTLATSLVALPFLVVPLSIMAKLQFTFRYTIASGLGFSLAFAWLMHILYRCRRAALPIGLAITALGFGFYEARVYTHWIRDPRPIPDRPSFEDPEAKSLPIFAQDPYLCVEMLSTWPRERVANLNYVLDTAIARRKMSQTMTEMNMEQFAFVRPLKMESYAELLKNEKQFLLYYDTAVNRDEIKGWLLKKLLDDGIPMQLLRRHGDILVYLVTIPGSTPAVSR